MRKLFKDTLRRLAEDDDRRQVPRRSNQAGYQYGGQIPPGHIPPGPAVYQQPPGPAVYYQQPGPAVYFQQPEPSGYTPSPPPVGIGTVQYATVPAPGQPGAFIPANSNQHGAVGPVENSSQSVLHPALPSPAPQPGLVSHSAITSTIPMRNKGSNSPSDTTYCRWCEKCRRGMAYGTLSFICVECRCWVCPDCRDVHQQGAHKTFVRAELWRWGAAPQSFSEAEALCVVCAPSKEVRARVQCKDCPYALCLSCAGTPAKLATFIAGHNVKHLMQNLGDTPDIKLLVVYPPTRFVTEKHRVRPCPCKQRSATAVTHCERCHLVIEMGQHVYWCRGCYSEWGVNQWLCQTCFEDEVHQCSKDSTPAADHKHDFIKTRVVSAPGDPDTRKEPVYCLVCKSWLATEKDRNTHFHAHTNKDTNIITRRAYLEWRISPWWLKMCQLSLSKGYGRVCK